MISPPPSASRSAVARLVGWQGAFWRTLVVPVGVALAAGAMTMRIVQPRWVAGGWSYAAEYPKNVEIAATMVGVAVGGLSAACAIWPIAWLAVAAIAIAGFAQIPRLCPGLPATAALLLAAVAAPLVIGLEWLRAPRMTAPGFAGRDRWLSLASLALLGVGIFVFWASPLTIDTFHDGEALAGALDLLSGGRPFVTFPWPHGLADVGGTALWIALTGKIGTSPIALMFATCCVLALPTFYLLLRRAMGSPAAAAVACWLTLLPIAKGWGSVIPTPTLLITGSLVWSAAAFFMAGSGKRAASFAAGAALMIGQVFRIDGGMFAAPAIAAAAAYGAMRQPAHSRLWHRARAAASTVALLAAGAAGMAGLARLVLGWPDGSWYEATFHRLPHYHSIATGLPFPWPCAPHAFDLNTAPIIFCPVLATLLIAALVQRLPRRRDLSPTSVEQISLLVFVAGFAFLSLRTALGRSTGHDYWLFLPLLCTAALCLSPWLAPALAPRRRAAAALVGLPLILGVGLAPRIGPSLGTLAEHLRPNPPAGNCADTMFTSSEIEIPLNATYVDAACRTEGMLRSLGIRRVLIDHSAPWDYVRFRMPLPSPAYSLNRAYTPADQQRVIGDIRKSGVEAILKVRGFGALEEYDVPNMYNIPVLEAYLRARRRDAPVRETPLGRLYLWNAPSDSPPVAASGTEDPTLAAWLERVTHVPSTGFLHIAGGTVDGKRDIPPATVDIEGIRNAEVSYAPAPAVDGSASRVGLWSVVARAPYVHAIHLRLTAADGRWHDVTIRLPPPRTLPPLDGPEWHRLRDAVDAAAALGAADREAAVRADATAAKD